MTVEWVHSVAAVNWPKLKNKKKLWKPSHRKARYKPTNDDEDVWVRLFNVNPYNSTQSKFTHSVSFCSKPVKIVKHFDKKKFHFAKTQQKVSIVMPEHVHDFQLVICG